MPTRSRIHAGRSALRAAEKAIVKRATSKTPGAAVSPASISAAKHIAARPTADSVILHVLATEFFPSQHDRNDETIRRRLRRRKLGAFDAARVERLRALRRQLRDEISRFEASRYFVGRHGKYCDLADFDVARLVADCSAAFPDVAPSDVEWFVRFCIFCDYLK